MKITVIGCWGGFPKVMEATSGYLIESDGFKLLLDCGSGVVSNIQKICDLKDIDAVLLSHYHYDHFCDIGPLQYGRLVKTQLGQLNNVLPVYGPNDNLYFNTLTLENYTKGFKYSHDSLLHIGPFEITFLKNIHPVQSYSMRIKYNDICIGYTSDTCFYDEMIEFFTGCDILISECSFYEDMSGTLAGHMNSVDVGRLAKSSKVKKLVISHLPHFGNVNDLVSQAGKIYDGEIILAQYMQMIFEN